MIPAKIRFMLNFTRKENECWIWKGNIASNDYGSFSVKGKNIIAHRFSYECYKGKIPKGLEIHHICERASCVNPNHLKAVQREENITLMKGRCKRREQRRLNDSKNKFEINWIKIDRALQTITK